jgi:hypothetical protein
VARRGLDLGFPLRSLVFHWHDAPQFATLPDLGPVLRACIVQRKWGANFLSHCLHCSLPVPRSASKVPPPDSHSCAILLNVLLATLLGLYPTCVKKPPFCVRANLFARVHALLTATSDAQARFAAAHVTLLVFCLAEYACRLLPALFPAEREAICAAQAVEAYFAQGPAIFDAFRQDCVDSGEEPWPKLAADAHESNDRLCRTYRSKCRLPQQQRRAQPAETSPELLRAALDSPKLVVYPCHRASDTLLRDEYAILLGSREFVDVALVHSVVRVSRLPDTIRECQVLFLVFCLRASDFVMRLVVAVTLHPVEIVKLRHTLVYEEHALPVLLGSLVPQGSLHPFHAIPGEYRVRGEHLHHPLHRDLVVRLPHHQVQCLQGLPDVVVLCIVLVAPRDAHQSSQNDSAPRANIQPILDPQEQALRDIAQRCQRQARVRSTHYVCLSCERRNHKSAPRLCSRTFRIVCQNCNDSPDCIPPINMLGCVVSVQSRQLYLAPCCGTIQEYTATGKDFNGPSTLACVHAQKARPEPAKKRQRHVCGVWHCQSQALPRQHRAVDHLEGTMECIYLCHRHTPPDEWLRRASNFRQFNEACQAWEAKCRPSHRK